VACSKFYPYCCANSQGNNILPMYEMGSCFLLASEVSRLKHCASGSLGVVIGTFKLQLQHFPSFLVACCINFQHSFDKYFI